MADEKKSERETEEKPVEPITLGAGIPWIPGRGNTLRSGGQQTSESGDESAEHESDAGED